jgi:hypothetical protein
MFLRRARVADSGAATAAPEQPGPVGLPSTTTVAGGKPAEQNSTTAARSPRIMRTVVVAGLIAGVLASGMLVWGSSNALFNGKTMQPTNSWAAGTVSVSDDDASAAMFTVSGILPGDSGSKCITVTYTGNVNADVRLYATLTGTGLGTYIDTVIDQGTGGSFASCTSFATEVSTSGTMATFAAARTNFATGFGTWAPTANGQTRTYRVAWAMQPDNGGISKTANLTLTWEARG